MITAANGYYWLKPTGTMIRGKALPLVDGTEYAHQLRIENIAHMTETACGVRNWLRRLDTAAGLFPRFDLNAERRALTLRPLTDLASFCGSFARVADYSPSTGPASFVLVSESVWDAPPTPPFGRVMDGTGRSGVTIMREAFAPGELPRICGGTNPHTISDTFPVGDDLRAIYADLGAMRRFFVPAKSMITTAQWNYQMMEGNMKGTAQGTARSDLPFIGPCTDGDTPGSWTYSGVTHNYTTLEIPPLKRVRDESGVYTTTHRANIAFGATIYAAHPHRTSLNLEPFGNTSPEVWVEFTIQCQTDNQARNYWALLPLTSSLADTPAALKFGTRTDRRWVVAEWNVADIIDQLEDLVAGEWPGYATAEERTFAASVSRFWIDTRTISSSTDLPPGWSYP